MTLKRRDFITLLGGAAAAWPLAARAQQKPHPVIGFLDSTTPAEAAYRVATFRQGLNNAGFFEGQNLTIEYRWAENRLDRQPALAADLVARRVAVIVVNAGAARAAMAATSEIPIVFVSGGDPVQNGFVTNLNRPGGNVTGVSFTTVPLEPKRLELLSELVPKPAVVGVLVDTNLILPETVFLQMYEASARAIGRQILILRAGNDREVGSAFETLVRSNVGGLLVGTGAFFTSRRRLLAALGTRHGIPTIHSLREFVVAGGLMSYGASNTNAYLRGGVYVGRILKGEKPGDLPVELPTEYELVINLATATALGLDLPTRLLALADEVME
jgi:putative ABC transport system substrate-binding protein